MSDKTARMNKWWRKEKANRHEKVYLVISRTALLAVNEVERWLKILPFPLLRNTKKGWNQVKKTVKSKFICMWLENLPDCNITIQKNFLIWISRSFKKVASNKTISYFDQSFQFSGLWLIWARDLGRSGQNKSWGNGEQRENK